jgi:hypothetical protein
MFGTAISWALRLAGPAVAAAAPYLPAPSVFKAALRAFVIAVALAFGAFAGWALHSWGEPERLEKARVEAVKRAELQAKADTQAKAIALQAETLRVREEQLDAAEKERDALKLEKENLRAQSKDPGGPVLPADDAWLQSKRARARDTAGVGNHH